jgi:ABC-type antimicrobial peptide transport system permease subunit
VFVPLAQHAAESLYLVVRTSGEPGAFAPALASVVRRIDPDLPLSLVRPMTQVLADFLAMGRAIAGLLAAFAALALLLAATGLLGVIGCVVGQRSREFGIRLALGATRGALLGLVLRRSLTLAFGGLVIGTAGGFAIARLLRAFVLDDIHPEPVVFAAVTVVVSVVALAASVLPLRRLLGRNPLLALREG